LSVLLTPAAPTAFEALVPTGESAFALFEQGCAELLEAGRGIARHCQDALAIVGGERHVLTHRDRTEQDPGGVVGAVSGEHARELEHLLAIHLDACDDRHLDESTTSGALLEVCGATRLLPQLAQSLTISYRRCGLPDARKHPFTSAASLVPSWWPRLRFELQPLCLSPDVFLEEHGAEFLDAGLPDGWPWGYVAVRAAATACEIRLACGDGRLPLVEAEPA
jgi:hypothetical protein